MDLATYRDLLKQARRLTGNAADAADLVQDSLLVALEARREDRAWLAGVLKKQAALAVRGATRRRRRERVYAEPIETVAPATADVDPRLLLDRLPPAARRVAVLSLHGLSAEEIRWILGLAPTAFRQRLTSIRRALGALAPEQRAEALALAYLREPARAVELQFGLVRRALKAALHGQPGLGTHDPDGHLLVLRVGAHKSTAGGNQGTGRTTPGGHYP
jgi:RNA polymerase sigma-70 factor (ECF subfamily)